jgi:hypothetical protein
MRRQLLVLTVAGVLGALLASDARACHMKKCKPACAPAPCVAECPPPPCAPAPVCAPSCAPAPKCGLFKHMGGCGHMKFQMPKLCHKKPACQPVTVCETAVYAPAPSAQAPSPQASGQ